MNIFNLFLYLQLLTALESVLEGALCVPDHPTEEGAFVRQRAGGPVLIVESNHHNIFFEQM